MRITRTGRFPVTPEPLRIGGPLPVFLRVSTGLLEAEIGLRLGEPGRAGGRLAEIRGEDAPDAAIGLARLELSCGHPEAVEAVATFLADEREPVLPFGSVEARVIEAIARDATHADDGALRALERPLDLAEPRGFSNVNTVKTHLKHVYRKLDVTDRRDCVKRPRDLRLLSPGLTA